MVILKPKKESLDCVLLCIDISGLMKLAPEGCVWWQGVWRIGLKTRWN